MYAEWILDNYPTTESALNKCREAAVRMVNEFPELELQVGFLRGRMHCWCKDESGLIIDPTGKQFGEGLSSSEYKFVANYLLRPDQVEEHTCIAFLDNGEVIVGH